MRYKRPKPPFRRILTFLLVLGSGYLLLCFSLAKLYVNPPRSTPPSLSTFHKIKLPSGEPAWVTAGLTGNNPKGGVLYVMLHGYGGDVGHFGKIASALAEQGYEVILTELSGHGDSPDANCEFGTKDADTLIEAARWGKSQYQSAPKVIVVGVSMGGAAAWLATQKAPELLDAISTEGSFARLDEVTDSWFDRSMPEGHLVFGPVKFFASKISGIDPEKVNPIEAAAKWKGKPALVIHCASDNLMRQSYAEELAKASGAKLWIIPGAEHAQGCVAAEEEYLAKLVDLAKAALAKDPS